MGFATEREANIGGYGEDHECGKSNNGTIEKYMLSKIEIFVKGNS